MNTVRIEQRAKHRIGWRPTHAARIGVVAAITTALSLGAAAVCAAPAPPVKTSQIKRPAEIALYADAAQINDFQDPASPDNPLLEEWYYLDVNTNFTGGGYYPNGHFRHAQRANVTFGDGHVDLEKMLPGSQDPRLANQHVGQLRPEILRLP